MSKLDRDLRFYETICSYSNVCFIIDVKTNGVLLTKSHINKALQFLKVKHPYLRMKFGTNEAGSLKFVEQSDEEKKLDVTEYTQLNNEDEFTEWQPKLIHTANKPRDFNTSLIYFHLYSLPSANRHQIACCINHSGIDGPGLFTVGNDLLIFLDSLLSNIEPIVESRNFEDVHNNYPNTFNLDELKAEKIVEDCLPPLTTVPEENPIDSSPIISAQFTQFDKNATEDLVTNCRANKTTVQGVISIATLIALLKSKNADVSKPLKTSNSVPCNMRGFIEPKLSNEDLICGSAALTWIQELNEDDTLWSLAKIATENIHKLRDSNEGVKWWVKLKNMITTQPYSLMTSSIGVVNFETEKLKNISVNDVRMMGGGYNLPATACSTMTHVVTALGRLTLVLSYTYPALSLQFAKEFANRQRIAIKYFTENQQSNKKLGEFLKELN